MCGVQVQCPDLPGAVPEDPCMGMPIVYGLIPAFDLVSEGRIYYLFFCFEIIFTSEHQDSYLHRRWRNKVC